MQKLSQNLSSNFIDKILSKLQQADNLIIKEYELFLEGKNSFFKSETDLTTLINKFYTDLKEAFEVDHEKNINLIKNYFIKIKDEFNKIDELLQKNKRIINKGINYINILKNQNFIDIKLVDQIELIEELKLNDLLDNNVNNEINLFLFQIKNNMLIPEINFDNKVYSLVQEIRDSFNIKINNKYFDKINIEYININNVLNKDINKGNISSLFMNNNEIYLHEENSELTNLIENLCIYINHLDINHIPKFIWFEPNSNNIYEILVDTNNKIITEKIEFKYIINETNNTIKQNEDGNYILFNQDFRISNIYNDLIYISGGLVENNNSKQILNILYEYSLIEKKLTQKPKMKIGRIHHGIILINDILYICGGVDQNLNITDTCEQYNIKENKWTNISSMKEKLSKTNLVQIDDKTFAAFGGIKNNNNFFNYNIHYYRIDTDTWFVLENFNMPYGISYPGLCKINSKYIVIYGGIKENGDESNDVIKMDISKGSFEYMDKLLNIPGYSIYFPVFANNEIHMLLNHKEQIYPDRIIFPL